MRIPAFALAVWLCVALHAHDTFARITYYESIELITAESDAMVRGTIVEIKKRGPGWNQHDPYRFTALIRVTETLKGPSAGEVSLALDALDLKFDLWQRAKMELLFSLRKTGGARPPREFVLLPAYGQCPIELDGNGLGVVTMDFQVLTSREDILKAARDGIATAPIRGANRWERFYPHQSSQVAIRAGIDQVINVLVPADQRLQELGERWATSKFVDFRALAPRALRLFKSDKTIAILKRLLSDDLYRDYANAKGLGTRSYPARLSAYVILNSWGVDVEKPVTEVPLRGLEHLEAAARTVFSAADRTWAAGGTAPIMSKPRSLHEISLQSRRL